MKRVEVMQDDLAENPRDTSMNQWTLLVRKNSYVKGDREVDGFDMEGYTVIPLWCYVSNGLRLTPKLCHVAECGYAVCELGQGASVEEKRSALIVLQAELDEYNAYLNGEVYAFQIIDTCPHCGQDTVEDTCGGFFSREACQAEGDAALEAMLTETTATDRTL